MQPWLFELSTGAFDSPAFFFLAYLDPGTGSYAIQLLLATLFGGMFALKQSWSQIKEWATLRFGGRVDRGEPSVDRPEIGIKVRPAIASRPRTHGQPTAEIR